MLQLRAMPVVFNTFAGWTTKNPIHIKRLWPVENPSGPLGLEFRYSVSRWPWIKKKKRTVKRNIQDSSATTVVGRRCKLLNETHDQGSETLRLGVVRGGNRIFRLRGH